MWALDRPKKNEQKYQIVLKESQVRELQQALLYHIDSVMIPFVEQVAKEQDYVPTQDLKKRVFTLQTVLEELNKIAGEYRES